MEFLDYYLFIFASMLSSLQFLRKDMDSSSLCSIFIFFLG